MERRGHLLGERGERVAAVLVLMMEVEEQVWLDH